MSLTRRHRQERYNLENAVSSFHFWSLSRQSWATFRVFKNIWLLIYNVIHIKILFEILNWSCLKPQLMWPHKQSNSVMDQLNETSIEPNFMTFSPHKYFEGPWYFLFVVVWFSLSVWSSPNPSATNLIVIGRTEIHSICDEYSFSLAVAFCHVSSWDCTQCNRFRGGGITARGRGAVEEPATYAQNSSEQTIWSSNGKDLSFGNMANCPDQTKRRGLRSVLSYAGIRNIESRTVPRRRRGCARNKCWLFGEELSTFWYPISQPWAL
jgi:hypothetical protein